jgi:hypothetical protein
LDGAVRIRVRGAAEAMTPPSFDAKGERRGGTAAKPGQAGSVVAFRTCRWCALIAGRRPLSSFANAGRARPDAVSFDKGRGLARHVVSR